MNRAAIPVLACAIVLSTLAVSHAGTGMLQSMKGQKVAVVVYSLNKTAQAYSTNALSRLESILEDNEVTVLDRKKADSLKDVCSGLEDPGAFITAEQFMQVSDKFDIKGLCAIYLTVDAVPGLADYFTATANADIRFISEETAKAQSLTTTPMGVPGRPPSDGLTEKSAGLNAVQRAVDDACEKLGMAISDPATPRSMNITLQGPVPAPGVPGERKAPENDAQLAKMAQTANQTWRGEKITCTAVAPAGAMSAVAGYIIDTVSLSGPGSRLYGSKVHLLDTESKREINSFECHPVERNTKQERGTKQVLDCMFIKNWRYLAAVTGNKIILWDTERGQKQYEMQLEAPIDEAVLNYARTAEGGFLTVKVSRKKTLAYRIIRQQ